MAMLLFLHGRNDVTCPAATSLTDVVCMTALSNMHLNFILNLVLCLLAKQHQAYENVIAEFPLICLISPGKQSNH